MEPLDSSSFISRSLLVAFIGTFIVFFVVYIRSKRNTSNGLNLQNAVAEKTVLSSTGYPTIIPLEPFNWETAEPLVFRPFKPKYHLTMAISPLEPSDLIPMDKTYLSRLSLRKNLLKEYPDVVRGVNIQPDRPTNNALIEEALCEWYSYVMGVYLPQRYPGMFRLSPSAGGDKQGSEAQKGTMLESLVTGLKVPIDPVELMKSSSSSSCFSISPSNIAKQDHHEKKNQLLHLLDTLGTWVDEDFLILLPSFSQADQDTKYHLEAYTTYYPSGFDTRTKLGRPLAEIHKPVPGYREKLEKSMDRFFERLEVGRAVVRVNWSVMTKGTGLFAAFGGMHHHEEQAGGNGNYGDGDASQEAEEEQKIKVEEFNGEETFLRCERQTLHRLPKSKALLFAFHTYTYPLQDIKDEGLGEDLAVATDGLKGGNVPQMFPYKRGPYWGEAVKAFLRA
ncbi:hypothetical protein BDV18DRAFT_130700 [Aspergillus unguis]